MSAPTTAPQQNESTTEEYNTEALAHAIAEACWERKALNVRVLDVRGIVSYTDFIVVCHGTNDRQTRAIAEHVVAELRPVKVRPSGIEGTDHGQWILVDFIDAVLHVFNGEQRHEYAIERIYSDAPRLALDPPPELEEPEESHDV